MTIFKDIRFKKFSFDNIYCFQCKCLKFIHKIRLGYEKWRVWYFEMLGQKKIAKFNNYITYNR